MSANRIIYDYSPNHRKLTQGSIINGCIAEDFPNHKVFGLIITPRCDLSHNGKVTTVHYIPVVPFELWFDVIAKPIIKEQWKKELSNKLDERFKNSNIGAGVMEVNFTYDDLCKIIEKKSLRPKEKLEIQKLLDDYYVNEDKAFNHYLLECNTSKRGHKMTDYLSRLRDNSIHPYYLIEGWKDYGERQHLVIMLRDVRHLDYAVANKIGNGVEESALIYNSTHNDLFLTESKNDFYYVQALIASPFIEHIMEAFIYNFSRIGVEDRVTNTLDLLSNSAKKTIE